MPNQPPACIDHYTLVSADDEPSRDPRDFTLEGYIDCPTSQGKSAFLTIQAMSQCKCLLHTDSGLIQNIRGLYAISVAYTLTR